MSLCICRCELQFDYGLRQKRFLKPQHRPKSFVSGSGKEIMVQQAIAQENFQVQKKGHVSAACRAMVMLIR